MSKTRFDTIFNRGRRFMYYFFFILFFWFACYVLKFYFKTTLMELDQFLIFAVLILVLNKLQDIDELLYEMGDKK